MRKHILFINGSPNREGNTVAMARAMLSGVEYDTLNLVDYKIYPLGQTYADDQFDEVMNRMIDAAVLVMGSPVYWHSMTGQFRTLLDRIYEPMLGQIVMGMLIDSFGWLRATRHEFTMLRLLALALILAGVVMVVFKKRESEHEKEKLLHWQILGFSGGAIFAMQPPMNSILSAGLSSAVHAAFISFLTATIMLITIVVATKNNRMYIPAIFSFKEKPWWAWLGGIIGGTFVTGFAFFASKVGIGLLLVTSICGMLAMSLVIDKYGILGAMKKRIGIMQYIGLTSVIAGIMILRLN